MRYFVFYYYVTFNDRSKDVGHFFFMYNKMPNFKGIQKEIASTVLVKFIKPYVTITGFNEFKNMEDFKDAQK